MGENCEKWVLLSNLREKFAEMKGGDRMNFRFLQIQAKLQSLLSLTLSEHHHSLINKRKLSKTLALKFRLFAAPLIIFNNVNGSENTSRFCKRLEIYKYALFTIRLVDSISQRCLEMHKIY